MLKVLVFLISLYLVTAQCPLNQFRNATSTLCENCPAGTYSLTGGNGLSTCLICASGTYSNQGQNCTTCTGGSCSAGSSEPLKETDTLLLNLQPFAEFNIQTLKVGFVFIPLLLTVFPLIVAAFTCWTEEFFRIFDVYENNHLISDGAPRVKQRTGLGGCCFLLACSIFSVFLGAAIVDFYFDNVRMNSRLTISPDSTKTAPFGDYSYQSTVRILGVSAEHCYGSYATSGYNVLTNGTTKFHCDSSVKLVKDSNGNNTKTEEHCYCSFYCSKCSIDLTQSITFTFPSPKVYGSAIFFNYKTPFAGSHHQINGSILAPTGKVFYGQTTPTEVKITHFSSIFKGLLGGPNVAALAQFINTFINIHIPATFGVTSQVDLVTKGTTTTSLTGTGGISVQVSGSLSSLDYVVDEYLTQTFIGHIGQLVGVFVLLVILCYVCLLALEHLFQFYDKHDKNGNIKKIKGIILYPYNTVRTFLYVKITGHEPKDSDSDDDDEDDEEEQQEEEKIDLAKTTGDIEELQNAIKLLTDKVAYIEKQPTSAPEETAVQVDGMEEIELKDSPKEEIKQEEFEIEAEEPKVEEVQTVDNLLTQEFE
eukprot:gene11599-4842_t